tara:strand:- start:1110 stop:2216 length:1107 start_codon:yes stop_codon:yes gene_type:complete
VNRSNTDNKDLELFFELLNNLYNTAKNELQFSEGVSVKMLNDVDNYLNPLGKTASYDPATKEINLYFTGRHPKDLLRSFSHELVHHAQNCRGDFADIDTTNEGYAQDDSHLREMEREAYECGNMIFRDWEDGLKKDGVVPLFNNSPFATIQMGYKENLGDNTMSKKNLSESQLRDIIRGVIQEMFNDDLNEEAIDDMNQDSMAKVSLAQAAAAAADPTDDRGENVDDAVGTSAMQEGHDGATKGRPTMSKPTKKDEDDPIDYEKKKGKIGGKVVEAEKLAEDSEGEETYHYGEDEGHDRKEEEDLEDHIDAIEHHLKKIKDDMGYDEDHEDRDEEGTDFRESYFPKKRSIRESARQQTFNKLVEKWCK